MFLVHTTLDDKMQLSLYQFRDLIQLSTLFALEVEVLFNRLCILRYSRWRYGLLTALQSAIKGGEEEAPTQLRSRLASNRKDCVGKVSHRCYFAAAHIWKVLRQEFSTNLTVLQVKQLTIEIYFDKYS